MTLAEIAEKHGLVVVDKGNGHFQIIGGAALINYYPNSKKRTAYIAGMAGSHKHVSPEGAVKLALELKPIAIQVKRKSSSKYKPIRQKLFAKNPVCYRCGKVIARFEDSSIEHVIPLSKGGLDGRNNMALSHIVCNNKAGNAMPTAKSQQRKELL